MAAKLLNVLALSSLAIIACSFAAAPANALSVDSHNVVRHVLRSHDAIARRKRASGKRCKNRPPPPATPPPATPQPSHKDKPKPSNKDLGQHNVNGGNGNGSNGDRKPSSSVQRPSHSGGGGKTGLGWPNGDDPSLQKYKTNKVSWLYTWAPQCPTTANKLGFECVPMLWGERQLDDFKRLVKGGYSQYVLGFNEPNENGQSNMSPQRGAQLWKQYIQPLASKGYSLISPATSSAPSGKTWMKDFFAACGGCTFNGIGVHYYDVEAQGFKAYATDFYNTFHNQLWITEFACQSFNNHPQCSEQHTWDYYKEIIDWMDQTHFVERYAAFGVMHDMQGVNQLSQLMGPGGGPTDLGKFYIGQ
jgi:hypothetical protein